METNTALPVLKPLQMLEILDQSIRLYRKNFMIFVGIIAIVYILIASLPYISTYLMNELMLNIQNSDYAYGLGPGHFDGMALLLFTAFLQTILVGGLGTTALTRAIADNYLNQPVGILEAFRGVRKSWLSIVGGLFLGGVLSNGLIVWTVVPCIGWFTGNCLLFSPEKPVRQL
ncbi:MAG: hypothetical protein JXA13_16525 [Anaerolineales bacterium]|nr:hypothetical protein [Anaerolineales bacterium]